MRSHQYQRTPLAPHNSHQSHSYRARKSSEDKSQQSNYYLAKYFEYNPLDRDLDKALLYYQKALQDGEKRDSTIKDLAGVLHQKGKTQEAVDFLKKNRKLYRGDLLKYDNLIQNLARQVLMPSGKNLNRFVLVLNMDRESNQKDIRSLFGNSTRIHSICFYKDLSFSELSQPGDLSYCLIEFPSYSAAKKTVDTFLGESHPQIQLYWVNVNQLLICQVCKGKEDTMKLNSHYFGFPSFSSALLLIPDSQLFDKEMLRQKNIQGIWKGPTEVDPVTSRRLAFQNETKLQLLRKRAKN